MRWSRQKTETRRTFEDYCSTHQNQCLLGVEASRHSSFSCNILSSSLRIALNFRNSHICSCIKVFLFRIGTKRTMTTMSRTLLRWNLWRPPLYSICPRTFFYLYLFFTFIIFFFILFNVYIKRERERKKLI